MALTIRLPRDPTPTHSSRRFPPRRYLLPLLLIIFLLIELFRFSSSPSLPPPPPISAFDLPPAPLPSLTTLLLVPCHGTYLSGPPLNDSSWALDPFSRGHHAPDTFLRHISTAVSRAGKDTGSLLVFSGGATRREAGARTEAEGYWELARSTRVWSQELAERTATEEHAADSYENLLFGLCRFFEMVGRFPETVVVVGFEFKRERWEEFRGRAKWRGRWEYLGIDPEWESEERKKVEAGEQKAKEAFTRQCTDEELRRKRESRRWGRRRDGYEDSCPNMAGLLRECEGGGSSGLPVPW